MVLTSIEMAAHIYICIVTIASLGNIAKVVLAEVLNNVTVGLIWVVEMEVVGIGGAVAVGEDVVVVVVDALEEWETPNWLGGGLCCDDGRSNRWYCCCLDFIVEWYCSETLGT